MKVLKTVIEVKTTIFGIFWLEKMRDIAKIGRKKAGHPAKCGTYGRPSIAHVHVELQGTTTAVLR